MMKKTTLIMIASAAMLFAAPPADMVPMQGKGMKQGMKQMMPGKKCNRNMNMKKKMRSKRMNSPYLIKRGLPHLTKMVMPYLDNADFALTAEQKTKLAHVRKETMGAIMKIKPEILALEKTIVTAGKMGTHAEDLQKKVARLAVLQAQATMTHLKCIEETKNILTKDQLLFLLSQKNRNMKHGQKPMKQKKCKKCIKRQ